MRRECARVKNVYGRYSTVSTPRQLLSTVRMGHNEDMDEEAERNRSADTSMGESCC